MVGTRAVPRRPPVRRSALRSAALAVLLLVAAGMAAAEPGGQPPIARVEVVTDGDLRPLAIRDLLGLAEGEPLDRQRLREGIRALYVGGGVERLEVTEETIDGGLLVTVTLRATPRLADFDVKGVSLLLAGRLRESSGLRRGAFITAGDVESAVARVRRRLDQMGWAAARVDPTIEYRRDANTVDVELDVDLGEPLTVAHVSVSGVDLPATERERFATRWSGDRVTGELGDEIVRAVEGRVRELGWWEAESLGTELSW